jgi:hypothetical protein
MKLILPAAGLLLALATLPLGAQTLRGRVLDSASGEAIAEAAVEATQGGHVAGRARTAADGSFSISLRAPGPVVLVAQRTGYSPNRSELSVEERETVSVELRLSSSAVAVEPLRVTARIQPPHRRNLEMAGFYDRERLGIGAFVRREDFENLATQNLAQLLQRTRGARIMYAGSKQFIYFPRNGEPTGGGGRRGAPRNGCLPRLYLDGVQVTYDTNNDINSVVSPNQVEAVELFRGSSEIPPQYGGSNAMCGVILVWTRHEM